MSNRRDSDRRDSAARDGTFMSCPPSSVRSAYFHAFPLNACVCHGERSRPRSGGIETNPRIDKPIFQTRNQASLVMWWRARVPEPATSRTNSQGYICFGVLCNVAMAEKTGRKVEKTSRSQSDRSLGPHRLAHSQRSRRDANFWYTAVVSGGKIHNGRYRQLSR